MDLCSGTKHVLTVTPLRLLFHALYFNKGHHKSSFTPSCPYAFPLSLPCALASYCTEQKYKLNTFVFAPFLWSKCSLFTQKSYFSQILSINLSKSVLVSTCPFAQVSCPQWKATLKYAVWSGGTRPQTLLQLACCLQGCPQSCWPWIEPSFLFYKSSPKTLQIILRDIQPASQP